MSLREQFLSLLRPRRTPVPARAMVVEVFEPRILHSADAAAALLPDLQSHDVPAPVEVRVVDANGEFAPVATETKQAQTEIVFVDTRTPDYQKLIDDIHAEAADGRAIEVVLLDNSRDGIDQITDVLSTRHDVSAVHIVSHGSDGSIQLGGSTLDQQSLQTHKAEIASWGNALSPDADLLIYGCDVAASTQGRSFIDTLSQVTGADVSASDNLTGSATAGGDWNLEYSTGSIESALAFDAATRAAWTGVLANSSPVLSGAENLPAITEDPASNPGTTVGTLIAGHVTDPDAGALTGIAVTGVDNSNGSWQYSTDAGNTWNSFVSPSATNATLLRSTDLVHFVPNADFNGSVPNGLTFRAWDQTTGTAGSTADTTQTTSTVLDTFSSTSYGNNNGTVSWSSNWLDSDGNPSAGAVQISGGRLQLQTLLGGGEIAREADLTGANTATLSFNYDNQILLSLGGDIELQVSDDGGATYTTLTTFSSGSNTGSGSYSANISGYISSDTRVRFVSSGLTLVQSLFVDNVQITYTTPLSSGMTAFSSATASSGIDVTAVNDAPIGTDNTVTTAENNPYVFTIADFGFTDPHDVPPDNFTGVTITTLPSAGSLTLNGSAVTTGQSIAPGSLIAGHLQFTPDAGTSGTSYAAFTFQVESSGGGSNIDTTPRTMTVNVTSVNDPPAGTSNTVSATEDGAHVFTAAEFGFTDPSDSPANNLLAVKISTLPGPGSLTLSGVGVTAGQSVSATDINAGRLVFTPAANANGTGYASFTFQVQDDGGGTDLDPIARTMTVDITAVNDTPVLVTNTGLTVNENSSATITSSKLLVTDADNTAAQLVFSVTTAPVHGHLELASAAGVAITSFTADDISNNQLVYVHDGSQTTSDGFSFGVSDGAGGSIGTTTFAIIVNPVNDAPVNSAPGTQSTAHDTTIVFSVANGNAFAVSDVDAGSSAIKVTLSATHGTLTLATTAGLTFAIGSGANDATVQFSGSQAAINAALDGMSFAAAAGYAGNATLSMVTNDLGNTGSGGALTATSTVAISIAAPPDTTGSTPIVSPIPVGTPTGPSPPGVDAPVTTAPTVPSTPGSPSGTPTPVGPLVAEPDATPNAPYEAANGSSPQVASDISSTRNGRLAGFTYSLPAAQWLMGSDETITGITEGSGSSTGLGGFGDGRSSLQSPALLDALDRLREGLQDQSRTEAIVVATTAAASLGLSVGYVLWLLRGGVLISSMLSSLPAWRMVDPLPILGRLDEDEDENAEDDSLESIVASGSVKPERSVPGDAT